MTVTFPQVVHRLAPVGGPLAGRLVELALLREAWADAAAGRSRVVLMAGEAGVGKTRLAAELAGEVDGAGGAVLLGRCPGAAEPFHPLVDGLGPLPLAAGSGGGDRDAMFEAMGAALAARARRAPVLLVLDDLHRADPSTLVALRRVLEAATGCPLLLVATYRDTGLDRSHPLSELLAWALGRSGVVRVDLGGLAPDALVDMVGDRALARRLWRQSEGNPVLAGELLRLGALDRAFPPSFDDLVARRADALRPAVRGVLDAAAVAGPEFDVDVVAAAAGVAPDAVLRAVKELATEGFVVEEAAGRGDVRRFAHEMVREAVVRRLDPAARVRLHLRVGEALEDAGAARVPAALVAWHFRAAAPVGGSEAARLHSVRAGDRAMKLLAWEEAAVQYGHAVAAASGVVLEARADLLLSLGEAQWQAGERTRARQAFLEAATLARAGRDEGREAPAGRAAAAETLYPARFTDFASDALYDVLDGRDPDTGNGAPAQIEPAKVDFRRSVEPTVAVLRARHVALAGPEHAADRLSAAGELAAMAADLGDDDLAATARGWRMVDALELGLVDSAAADQVAHAELSRRLDDPRHAADAAVWSAMQALLEGRVADARAAASHARALGIEAGDPEADRVDLVHRWSLALEWGSPGERAEVADECRAQAETAADARAWRAATALVLARDGRLGSAAEELSAVTDHGLGELLRHPGRLHALTCLAEVAWILGDGHRAAGLGPLLEPFADRLVVVGRGWACRGSVARACGLVAASAARFDDAQRHFDDALAVHRRIGALPMLARTQYEWSTVVLRRGRKGGKRRATDLRRRATELAGRLGMARLLEEMAGPAT